MDNIKPRTSRDEWFLDLADRCAQQATCLRRRFGAIIVDEFGTIVSTGYAGAPRGMRDCLEKNYCWRAEHNIPSGKNYEMCRSVHAEQNALLQAGKLARGSTMYISGFDVATGKIAASLPCFLCAKMIVNAGIRELVIRQEDGNYKRYNPKDVYDIRIGEIHEYEPSRKLQIVSQQ